MMRGAVALPLAAGAEFLSGTFLSGTFLSGSWPKPTLHSRTSGTLGALGSRRAAFAM
jgi:hypothetical protein